VEARSVARRVARRAERVEQRAAQRRVRPRAARAHAPHPREHAREHVLHLRERVRELVQVRRRLRAQRRRREQVHCGQPSAEGAGKGARDARPARSALEKRSVQGTGTNTQFSGFGSVPTGELRAVSASLGPCAHANGAAHEMYALTAGGAPSAAPASRTTCTAAAGAVSWV
jgi:hypothetical protein